MKISDVKVGEIYKKNKIPKTFQLGDEILTVLPEEVKVTDIIKVKWDNYSEEITWINFLQLNHTDQYDDPAIATESIENFTKLYRLKYKKIHCWKCRQPLDETKMASCAQCNGGKCPKDGECLCTHSEYGHFYGLQK